MKKGFICEHCGKFVTTEDFIGTAHRNHCPFCLWSKHEGQERPTDRIKSCHELMEPIGLTFKQEGFDKFTKKAKQGEIMIVHQCQVCYWISINRIAGDDNTKVILGLLNSKFKNPLQGKQKSKLQFKGLKVLGNKDEEEVRKQLFGK